MTLWERARVDEDHRIEGRYRLRVDLSAYHPAFKAGVEGAAFMHSMDCYLVMRLDDGSMLDVLWKSVERVDRPGAVR